MDDMKIVFISGASGGIGKATAELLYEKGYKVYGTSRNAKFDDNLEKINCNGAFFKLIPMDILNNDSVEEVIDFIIKKEGKIDILINNIGYALAGSIEDVNEEEIQMQFETNLFGHLRVIRRVLPGMRRCMEGKIINISSLGAEFIIPYQAIYSGSKRAMEGITEALYIELKPFNIGVSIIDPGNIKTDAPKNRQCALNYNEKSAYYEKTDKAVKAMVKEELNGMPPESVAKTIYNVLKKKKMPIRKVPGLQYKILLQLKRVMPLKAVLYILEKMY
jgi:short-subunit dehydrogenase